MFRGTAAEIGAALVAVHGGSGEVDVILPPAPAGRARQPRPLAGATARRGPGRPRKDGSPAQPRLSTRRKVKGKGKPAKLALVDESGQPIKRGPGRPRADGTPAQPRAKTGKPAKAKPAKASKRKAGARKASAKTEGEVKAKPRARARTAANEVIPEHGEAQTEPLAAAGAEE